MSAGAEPTGLARLADVIGREVTNRHLNLSELAARAGIDRQTLYNIQNGKNTKLRAATKQGVERAFGWAQGSVDAILAGSKPTPLGEAAAPPADRRPENAQTAFDQLRDAVDRLRTEAQADPAADPAFVEVLEDFEVLSYALRRLGPRSYQRAVIELASRYQRERGTDDTAYQAG